MRNIPKFLLNRVGSDPEFLFVRRADLDFIITPACDILGKDKAKTTTSFIGTDNRPVLAELRPTPSHNLKRHLYDIAYALDVSQKYVDEKRVGHYLFATPHLHHETLGGHIHISGFIDDALYLEMLQYGYTVGHQGQFQEMVGKEQRHIGQGRLEEWSARIANSECLTPYDWGRVMGYLLEPFENWVQPWTQRELRNQHYGADGGPGDLVRLGTSKGYDREGLAYVHWEYRMPSTWLVHPYLAAAYLALAKFTMINWRRVAPLAKSTWKSPPKPKKQQLLEAYGGGNEPLYNFKPMKAAENDAQYKVFQERLNEVMRTKPLITPDISNLVFLLGQCEQRREQWFGRTQPVMVEEWRKLL